jgi:hypothetical protein
VARLSVLGLILVIVCGAFIGWLVLCGTAEALFGDVDLVTLIASVVVWAVGLSVLTGFYYGLHLLHLLH